MKKIVGFELLDYESNSDSFTRLVIKRLWFGFFLFLPLFLGSFSVKRCLKEMQHLEGKIRCVASPQGISLRTNYLKIEDALLCSK